MRTRKSAGTRISFLACPFLAKGQSGFSSRYGRLRLWLVKERRNIRKNVCEEYTKGIYEIKSCDQCLVYSYHSKWTILATGVIAFTAHGLLRRTTLLFLITLITKTSLFGVCIPCPVFLEKYECNRIHHRIQRKWRLEFYQQLYS